MSSEKMTTASEFLPLETHQETLRSDAYSYFDEGYVDKPQGLYVSRFIDSFRPFDYSILPDYLHPRVRNVISRGSDADHLESTATGSETVMRRLRDPRDHPYHPQFDYSRLTDLERAAIVTSHTPLLRSLTSRHLKGISVSASIGVGIFVGMGSALQAGPFGLLISYLFISSIVFVTMSSLVELASSFPVSGSFSTFNLLFLDLSWGFAMIWNYALQWLVTLPLEIVAAAITIDYWNPNVSPVLFAAIFWVVIVIMNLFGVKGYGEVEYAFSLIKVAAVVGFLILSVVLVAGGAAPDHRFIGGSNWRKPQGGMFNESEPFKNVCATFFTAAFAFAGVELIGLASCETANPNRSIVRAKKRVYYNVLVFYILTVVAVGLLVSYKNPGLIGSGGEASAGVDINISPFVIAIKAAKIPVLPSIMNVVILITTISVGNSSVYGSSRTMAAIGALRQGPQILGYIDKNGRPLVALLVQFTVGLLCFLIGLPKKSQTIDVFQWMLSISGFGSLLTYFSICLCHIRFRSALASRARNPKDELVYCASVYGSWYGMGAIVTTLCLQFWAALYPPGNKNKVDLVNFFKIYVAATVIIVFYVGHKLYAWWFLNIPLTKFYLTNKEINVDAGRREIDLEMIKQEIAEERAMRREKPWYYAVYRFFC